eukprot:EG_transcript_32879
MPPFSDVSYLLQQKLFGFNQHAMFISSFCSVPYQLEQLCTSMLSTSQRNLNCSTFRLRRQLTEAVKSPTNDPAALGVGQYWGLHPARQVPWLLWGTFYASLPICCVAVQCCNFL